MSTYRIAVWPGDGIGTDVTAEAVKALGRSQEAFGFGIEATEFPWNCRRAVLQGENTAAPDDFLDRLREFDAVYLGAVGDPAVMPDHISLAPLIRMRQGYDQYVCLRPAKLLPHVRTPLAGKSYGDIDLVVVRENSEGEYTTTGGRFRRDTEQEIAIQTAVHTRRGIHRILSYGFELARRRRGRLALATKSNALAFGMVLWDEVLEELTAEFTDVQVEKCHVDAMTMHFVNCPERFDVVVASNLFGDILSDLAGAISGSLGLAPSANLNPERAFPSLFEPVHGSAPDIVGKGIANPIAAIRSAGLMLDFLGEAAAAEAIEQAVVENLSENGPRTPDIGGTAGTADVGDDIARRIRQI